MTRPAPLVTVGAVLGGLLLAACVHGRATLDAEQECPEGSVICDGSCTDTSGDADHCGGCGDACASGESCDEGSCAEACDDGLTRCDGACVDTDSDPDHCGGCGDACATGEVCSAGECLTGCPAGTTDCGGSCVDVQTDASHCGGCGEACGGQESCTAGQCYGESCRSLLEADPSLTDGLYTVDPDGSGGEAPFEVACDMSTDGGGWFQLQLNDSQSLLMAQSAPNNPWTKCDDDSAKHFDWIAEGDVTADYEGTIDQEVDLAYLNPQTDTALTPAQVDAIRTAISELSVTTRMVASTADDDDGDWQNTMVSGHEVYVMGASMTWTLLTPGSDGECGGTADYPLLGTSGGHYLWHTSAISSQVDGTTGLTDGDLTGLGIGDILPLKARLVVQTGGGVSFGWEKEIFLVR